ncbi:transposase [Rhizobium ruizarguesonis]|uniref:transposase n=1 Tax=Rhizobium ruizarguesonis TaxID=2081791 RepID=UPI002961F916|nr:transposase [Rhizobium ruizarguesonis]
MGRSRGGRSTKIHAVVDGCGRPIALRITPGQRGDAPVAVPLLTPLPASSLCAADTAYDSDTYATSSPPAARSRSFRRQSYSKAHTALRPHCLQAQEYY